MQLYIYPGIWPNTLKGRKSVFYTSAYSYNADMEANVTEQNNKQTKQGNVILFCLIHIFESQKVW